MYIALFLAIRSGNWTLRMAALKQMAPLFTAFEEIKSHLRSAGFSVSVLGRTCHSVYESHEMCVNKECKEYITRPLGENMNRIATISACRAKAIKNLGNQLFADRKAKTVPAQTLSLLTSDPEVKKHEANVRAQIVKICVDSRHKDPVLS